MRFLTPNRKNTFDRLFHVLLENVMLGRQKTVERPQFTMEACTKKMKVWQLYKENGRNMSRVIVLNCHDMAFEQNIHL